jgi:predicted O-methyltransferase YrrM
MTTTKPATRRFDRRSTLQGQCVLFFSTIHQLNSRSVETWANQIEEYWKDVSVNGDPNLDPDFPVESVGVTLRYNVRGLRESATGLDEGAKGALDRIVELLPSTWRRGEQAFSSNFVMGHVVHWRRVLEELKGKPDLHFLEVGSFEGLSCIWMFTHILTDPSSRITCVDSFDFGGQLARDPSESGRNIQDRFDENIQAAGLKGRVDKRYGYSQIVMRTLPLETYDHIYIDASHMAPDVLEDVVLAYRLMKKGGLATFDDYGWQAHDDPRQRPTMALDAFVDIFKGKVEVVHKGYQLVLRRLE